MVTKKHSSTPRRARGVTFKQIHPGLLVQASVPAAERARLASEYQKKQRAARDEAARQADAVDQAPSLLDCEAARLAGVSEIMREISDSSGVANSLGVLRDTVNDINERISTIAQAIRFWGPASEHLEQGKGGVK